MSDNKRVLVVGGAGYLGCVLVPILTEAGYEVSILDRCFFGPCDHAVIRRDMREEIPLDGYGAIINIGGLSNDPTAEFNEAANYSMNTDAAIVLAERAKAAGVSRYVYASSASLYDVASMCEEDDVVMDEDLPIPVPTKPYSHSKYLAERGLLPLSDESFAVTCLRKGTLYGQSPRMRYDLVVNAFVKDALTTGTINLHGYGRMWRPLVSVSNAAKAYLAVLDADADKVAGQIFNVVGKNWRISELALYASWVLDHCGVPSSLKMETGGALRSYRISGRKLQTLGWNGRSDITENIEEMVDCAQDMSPAELYHPRYYNIAWMKLLEETRSAQGVDGSIFDIPEGV